MGDPEIIDVHVHLTRDAAQERLVYGAPRTPDAWYTRNGERLSQHLAAEGLAGLYAINYMDTNRMMRGRLQRMPGAGEEARAEAREALVTSVERLNDWVCEYARTEKRIVPFVHVDIGVYHDQDRMMAAMHRLIEAGARGVKIHPGLDRILPGDRRMFPLYELLQARDIAVLSDSGSLVGPPVPGEESETDPSVVFGQPLNFVPVFESFPRLKFIMAHACSAYWDEREFIADRFPSVRFDTAGGFHSTAHHARDGHRACPIEDAVRFLRKLGTHRVLFGSDGEPRDQLKQLFALALTDGERQQILGKNAREFVDW